MSADLDKAIDRAVREMLDVEPRADLRARVLAQLTASGFRLPAFGWVLAPIAAAAVIVLAVMLAPRSESLPQAPVVAHATDRRLPADAAPAPPVRRGDPSTHPATPRVPEAAAQVARQAP